MLPTVAFALGTGLNKWIDAFEEIGRLNGEMREVKWQAEDLREQNSKLSTELKQVLAKSELLARYGADFVLYRHWEAASDEGDTLLVGQCAGGPCFVARFEGIRPRGETSPPVISFVAPVDVPKALIGIRSAGIPAKVDVLIGIPLLKGCKYLVQSSWETLQFEIEDDRHASVALGVIVRPTQPDEFTSGGEVGLKPGGCPSV